MTAIPALRARDIVRWVIGLLVGDLLRWARRADQPAARKCRLCMVEHGRGDVRAVAASITGDGHGASARVPAVAPRPIAPGMRRPYVRPFAYQPVEIPPERMAHALGVIVNGIGTKPPEYRSAGAEALGFEYGSDEAKRQRLDSALYWDAVYAIHRARRR